MADGALVKVDDHGLLYRQNLETRWGVTFEPYQPANDDTTPHYPIRWVASWRNAAYLPCHEILDDIIGT